MSYDVNDGTVSSYDSRIGYYLISAGYTHDDLMRLSGVEYSIGTEDEDYPNTVTQTYDYLTYTYAADDEYESHLISSVTTVFPQNGGTETLNYTYDSNGNITEIRRGTTVLCRYEYDDLGQLVREDNSDLGKTYVWDYDAAGNILSKKTYAYTTGTLGSAPSTISYGYGNSTWGDLLISYYGNTITYDAIGNPLSWGDYGVLTWQGRRLESYTDSESEETFTYTYNSDGIRTSKTIDGVEHIYHLAGTQILSEEWTENGVQHLLIYIYDASGAPIGMAYRDSTYVSGAFDFYLFAKNIQGDILYIYNSSGTRLVTYTYDAWGKCYVTYQNGGASTAARYNPFRYRGYYYDTETGFYYLNSRYYDPELGRFLNADGYINGNGDLIGYNMFAYCGNNSVNMVDDDGTSALLIAEGGYASYLIFASSVGTSNCWNPIGIILLTTAVVAGIAFIGFKVYNKRKSQHDAAVTAALELMDYASTAATPPPPNKGGKGTQTNSKTLYEKSGKNGFRIDVENPGNRQGQIHLQKDGIKYYYNVAEKSFRIGSSDGSLAPRAIQDLLSNQDVIKAIGKGLKYLGY